jgi:hypothetical protein
MRVGSEICRESRWERGCGDVGVGAEKGGWGRVDLAHWVHSPRREVIDFEEGFHDVRPLDIGVHARDMNRIEPSAVLEVHYASILNEIPSSSMAKGGRFKK